MSLNLQELRKISFFEGLSAVNMQAIYRAGREYPVKQGTLAKLKPSVASK
jgi:hypothetical protein